MNIPEEITEQALFKKIKKANEAYRNGKAIMSDVNYDSMVTRLKMMNPDHEWFKKVEPVEDVPANRKVKLPHPMKSLDKAKTMKEIESWLKNTVNATPDTWIVVTPKFDGISVLYNETTGMAYSRGGSDNEGMDCSAHMKYVNKYSCPDFEYTFGELIISKQNWHDHFQGKLKTDGTPYKSPRNTVSGLFRKDVAEAELLQYVDYIRYGCFEVKKGYDLFDEILHDFQKPKQYSTPWIEVMVADMKEERLQEWYDMWNQQYNIDGLVLYVNVLEDWERIGRDGSTGNPKYAIAYKPMCFSESAVTTVQNVFVRTSKTGRLKPVVQFDTVFLNEADINEATGYNAKFCIENGIGPGAEVEIVRSGQVIPVVKKVIKETPNNPKLIFTKCPSCGCDTEWDKNKVDMLCTNLNCPDRLASAMLSAMISTGFENVGWQTVSDLVHGGIKDLWQLLEVKNKKELQRFNFSKDIVDGLMDGVKRVKEEGIRLTTLADISNIFESVGPKKAEQFFLILDNDRLYKFLHKTLKPLETYNVQSDIKRAKVSDKLKRTMLEGMDQFCELLYHLEEMGIRIIYPCPVVEGFMKGQKICCTGFRDKGLEDFILNNGGEIVSGVSKNTTLLILQDVDSTSTKAAKARTLGIKIISRKDFLDTYMREQMNANE